MIQYDLIIIGGGPGGYEAAAHAAKHGLKTLLIENIDWVGPVLIPDVFRPKPCWLPRIFIIS